VSTIRPALGGALVVVASLALAVGAPAGRGSVARPQLGSGVRAAVVSIAGAPVAVRCSIRPGDGGLVEPLGHAVWNTRLIELAPRICRTANTLATTPARPYSRGSFTQAQALLVVVHESVHVSDYSGRSDEALTECRAIQLVREAALQIGVADVTARALGHEALRFDARLPGPGDWRVGLNEIPSYHSLDCHDGGSLDIHAESNDWPN
jgi:hypothetical protein